MKKEYLCRTEVVNKIEYRLETFKNGRPCSIETSSSKEDADRQVKSYAEHIPELTCKITEEHYTETVCVECGREEF